MKPKSVLLSCALIASTLAAQAQTHTFEWQTLDMIPFQDSMAIVRGEDRGGNEHIVLISHSGAPIGQEVPLTGKTIGMAILKRTLLVFYEPEARSGTREVLVRPVDLDHMQAGSDKTVYSNTTPFQTAFVVERSEGGAFLGLLARVTAYKSKKQDPLDLLDRKTGGASTAIDLVTFGEGLEPRKTTIAGDRSSSWYIASFMNTKGMLFLLTFADNQLMGEKCSPSGVVVASLQQPWLFNPNHWFPIFSGYVDDESGDALTFDVTYQQHKDDAVCSTFRFDFAGGTARVKDDMLDKNYFRALKPLNNGKDIRVEVVEDGLDLNTVSVVENKDYIVVCREMQPRMGGTNNDATVTLFWNAAILSVYDHQLNPIKTIILAKRADAVITNPCGIRLHFDGDKLLALTFEGYREKEKSVQLYTIDPKNGVLGKKTIKSSNLTNSRIAQPIFTWWSDRGLVVEYSDRWAYSIIREKAKPKTEFIPAEYQ